MGSYVPNTKEQRQEMLKEIGFQTIDDLFAHIPAEVKIQGGLNIPEGKTELEVRRDMEILLQRIRSLRRFSVAQALTGILFRQQ